MKTLVPVWLPNTHLPIQFTEQPFTKYSNTGYMITNSDTKYFLTDLTIIQALFTIILACTIIQSLCSIIQEYNIIQPLCTITTVHYWYSIIIQDSIMLLEFIICLNSCFMHRNLH